MFILKVYYHAERESRGNAINNEKIYCCKEFYKSYHTLKSSGPHERCWLRRAVPLAWQQVPLRSCVLG